jgi:hypothetical protein
MLRSIRKTASGPGISSSVSSSQVPQVVQQVGVVAVAAEGLRVRGQDPGVQVRKHGELIVAADRGEHRADPGVGEGLHQVRRPGLGRGTQLAGGRILDRLDA